MRDVRARSLRGLKQATQSESLHVMVTQVSVSCGHSCKQHVRTRGATSRWEKKVRSSDEPVRFDDDGRTEFHVLPDLVVNWMRSNWDGAVSLHLFGFRRRNKNAPKSSFLLLQNRGRRAHAMVIGRHCGRDKAFNLYHPPPPTPPLLLWCQTLYVRDGGIMGQVTSPLF